jgi:hypothetical protein
MAACDQKEEPLTAQKIIDKAIERSCNGYCEKVSVEFTFRDRRYLRKRYGGSFEYQRITFGDHDTITDVLSNDGFKRFINDTLVNIPDSMVVKYSNSVNSVHYFSQLPYGLNDNAVNKKLLGNDTINNNIYYEIQVTFDQEGGGKDYEDVFIFWIDQNDLTVDYLAYEYFTDGGGIRFREAYNERVVNGIRFMDYNNYKPKSKDADLRDVDRLFEEGKLDLLSKIESEDLKVTLIKDNLVDG